MTVALSSRRAVLTPPWVKRPLWKAAREVPSWHIAPALIGDLTDLVAGQSLVTFTNSSPAWGFNSSGVLVQPSANVPFIEYDPATGSALGWRIWDAVLNRLPSAAYTANANNWTNGVVGGTGSITSQTTTNPANTTTNVNQISGLDSNSYVGVFVNTTSSSNSNTASIFVKNNGGTLFQLRLTYQDGGTFRVYGTQYNFSTGAWQDGIAGTTAPAERGVQILPNGWFRFWVTGADNNSGNTRAGLLMFGTSATSSYNYYIWKAQINPGSIAPFVDTTGLTASSTADVASISGAAFAGIYREDEATLFASWLAGSSSASRYLLDIEQAASNSNRIDININTSNTVNPRTVVSGTPLASLNGGTYTAGAIAAIAFAYKAGDYASSLNGASVVTNSTAGSLPASPARLFIGSLSGNNNFLNGYVREMATLKSRRPNANLQAMTQ